MVSNEKNEDKRVDDKIDKRVEDEIKQIKEDTDVIDFMNIVDQVIVKVGNEVSLESDEINESNRIQSNSDESFYEKRVADVNNLEEETHERLEELNTIIREEVDEEELLNVVSESIEDLKPFENPKDDEYKNDDNKDDLHDVNNKQKNIENNSKNNKKNVIIMTTDLIKGLPLPYTNDLRIKKYPGLIYINLSSIERYMSTNHNVKSVNVRLESNDLIYETPEFKESSRIPLDTLVYFNIRNMDSPVRLRLILQKNIHDKEDLTKVLKVCETEIVRKSITN
jgi:hypothetical protein